MKEPLWVKFFVGSKNNYSGYVALGSFSDSPWGVIQQIIRNVTCELPFLTLALIVLKLCGTISFGWRIVLTPFAIHILEGALNSIINYIVKLEYDKWRVKCREEEAKEYAKRLRDNHKNIMDELYEEDET